MLTVVIAWQNKRHGYDDKHSDQYERYKLIVNAFSAVT